MGRKFHGARFEDDPYYNAHNHVHTTSLPEPAGKRELDDLVSAKAWVKLVFNVHSQYRWASLLHRNGTSPNHYGR